MTAISVDVAELESAVETLALGVDVFEFHGGICGALCARGPGAVEEWLHESGVDPVEQIVDRELLMDTLRQAEAESWRALNTSSFDFALVLPAEEVELGDRVAALAAWCRGFVTGMGLGGYSGDDCADEDRAQIEEILADLSEVSRVALSDEDLSDSDQAGFDLAAVTEHVRVCAQLAFELLRGTTADAPGLGRPATTH